LPRCVSDVAPDHAREEIDDRSRRAVVDRQVVARGSPPLVEAKHVVDLRATEGVDRLVLVRDAEDVAALAGVPLEEPFLRDVRVLVPPRRLL
jgi:hypothetical protein